MEKNLGAKKHRKKSEAGNFFQFPRGSKIKKTVPLGKDGKNNKKKGRLTTWGSARSKRKTVKREGGKCWPKSKVDSWKETCDSCTPVNIKSGVNGGKSQQKNCHQPDSSGGKK